MSKSAKSILLLNPLSSCGDPHMASPGLAFIASYLNKHDCSVLIFDRNIPVFKKHLDIEECDKMMIDEIADFQPDYLGISMMTPLLPDAIECARIITRQFPEVTIILGGVHPTFETKRVLKQIPDAQIVVRGPGESILCRILHGDNLRNIPNIVFRENDTIHETELEKLFRREEISIDYERFSINEYWTEFTPLFNGLDIPGVAYMISSQGCPGHCSFCVDDRFLGTGFLHSDDFVLDEMEMLVERYRRRVFVFLDRVFRLNPQNVISFCKRKIDRGLAEIPWYAPFRAEFITDEVASWLRKAGCFQVNIGLESGSQKILDSLRKGTTVEMNYNVCRILQRHSIALASAFVYGLPGQTEKDLETNLTLFDSFQFFDSSVNQILPLPGSELYHELCISGKLNPDDPDYYDWIKSVGQPIPQLNFSEIEDDNYVRIFHEHANYIFDRCKQNRSKLLSEYGLGNIFIARNGKQVAKYAFYEKLKGFMKGT